ncbi:LOW QUALITY PROTEIN: hypothetical protein PHMEG_00027378 [Phytophthora megakarya]|uniref:Tyr recombinase domain-containing protein n=1 Tax=Phytophthora megakarya TaxID=4795 RepID=A0A225V718_9STRA|nr:LOW QUALITY PROTEIN: hypothetical protein PHMEG_00027378 [Phytophthora megakarya]
MFAFMFDGYVVIDLSCGFGWCASPAFYSLAGDVINDLYVGEDVADATTGDLAAYRAMSVNRGQRCQAANLALRRAMATVLGPKAINDKKFTPWLSENKALGLLWNTADGTVSIPDDKLVKAKHQVASLLSSARATKSELAKVLGVFRYITTCFPPARAFYQRIHVEAISRPPFGSKALIPDAFEDLRWFQAVLGNTARFNGIPVAQVARTTTPSVHVYMDASGSGLCVLEPQRRECIRVKYTAVELAALRSECSPGGTVLGAYWKEASSGRTTYACFHIDNTSAVAWASKRLSRHPTVQLYNRLLSLVEFEHDLSFTAAHIPGQHNTMVDAGSRAWTDRHPLWNTWTNLSLSWLQVQVRPPFDDLLKVPRRCYNEQVSYSLESMEKIFPVHVMVTVVSEDRSVKLQQIGIFRNLPLEVWLEPIRSRQSVPDDTVKAFKRVLAPPFLDVDLSRSPLLKVLLQGIKRLSDPTKKKLPVTPAFLRILRRSLQLNRPRDRLLWDSVLLAYFFLLRLGRHRHPYCLKTQDAFFTDARGNLTLADVASSVTIGLSGVKNDQYGRGAWRSMHQSGDRSLCPVRALKHLLQARRELSVTSHEHLCADLTAETVSKALKTTASRAGVDSTKYSTHSLRSGGATALLSGKADSMSIKILGRWVSHCFEEYPLQSAASTSDLLRRMVFTHQTQRRPSNR